MKHVSINLRLALVGLHLAWGAGIVAAVYPFIRQPRRERIRSAWSRQLLTLLKLRIETALDPLADIDHGLLVANHVSFIDIFAINAVLPSSFVAKDEVAGWPLIGWLAARNDTVFIERGSRRAAQATRQRIQSALAAGKRLAVFPEGTTSPGVQVLPFHSAMFQGAIDASAKVHVLAVEYLDATGNRTTTPAYIDDLTLMDCLRAVLARNGMRVRIALAESYCPPLPDRRQLAHRAHLAASKALRHHETETCPQPFRNETAIGV